MALTSVALHLDIAIALCGLIGLALGLLGGGGSILAVPVLVYVAHIAPADAIAMSLAVVGATSVVAAIAHGRAGYVDVRAALWFGGSGIVAAFAGAHATRLLPPAFLLLSFAALMIVVGVWMLVGRQRAPRARSATRPRAAALAGLGVGLVTGLLGVGGGFLVVPALTAFTGLGMREAVGTSLVIIAINSAAGLLGHLGHGNLHLGLASAFAAAAVIGALVGTRLVQRTSVALLRRGFAWFVIAVGIAMALHGR